MPLEQDGSTLRAAVLTLNEHFLDWQLRKGSAFGPDDAAVRDQALAVFDTAADPFTPIDGLPFRLTYGHLAAGYHRLDLLRRFVATKPECLTALDNDGENILHRAAWSDGPAVQFLVEQGVPLQTKENTWNAISAPISESLNDNFDVMIGHLGFDDPIERRLELRMIHYAAQHGNMYVIARLAEHKANLKIQDRNGNTALHYAALAGQTDAFCHLLPYIDVRVADNYLFTAMSCAALAGEVVLYPPISWERLMKTGLPTLFSTEAWMTRRSC